MLELTDDRARGLSELCINGVIYDERRRPDIYADALLHQENERLREHIKELSRELYEAQKRHTLYLPRASQAQRLTSRVWTVSLRVGESPSCAFEHAAKPSDHMGFYRLNFELEHSERGVFWRVLPFATEPE